jgi:hypothetical protein
MKSKYIFFAILLILFLTNPFDNSHSQTNFYVFTLRESYRYGLSKRTELGLLLNFWFTLPNNIKIGCKNQCKNGFCFLSKCYCLSGFYGKRCTWKRVWFRSVFDDLFYAARQTPLGIPVNWIRYALPSRSARIVDSLQSTLFWNMATKLTILDLILSGMVVAFLYLKLIQLKIITGSSRILNYLNLNRYSMNFFSLFLYPFNHPQTLTFIFNFAFFIDASLSLLEFLGSSTFYFYIMTCIIITGLGHLIITPSKSLSGSTALIISMELYVALINNQDIILAFKEMGSRYFMVIAFGTGLDLVSVVLSLTVTILFSFYSV